MLCENRGEWDGVGGGKEIQEGGDISPMADSLQLKINKLLKI